MTLASRQITDRRFLVNTGQDLSFKNLRERWLPLAIHEPASFHQFLANVSLNIARLQGEDLDGLVTIAHHSLAIRSLNKNLSDPAKSISDDVLASIVELVCYSVGNSSSKTQSFSVLTKHRSAEMILQA